MKELKKVMCFGTFDKFHPGHTFYLNQSKKEGDYLIVVVARDINVKKIKNKVSSQNENKRLDKLKSLDFVNDAVLGGLKDRFAIVKEFNPDIISLGYDQQVDEEKLRSMFDGRIVRQESFNPEIYKSSKIKNE
jgi:FAD synthetase